MEEAEARYEAGERHWTLVRNQARELYALDPIDVGEVGRSNVAERYATFDRLAPDEATTKMLCERYRSAPSFEYMRAREGLVPHISSVSFAIAQCAANEEYKDEHMLFFMNMHATPENTMMVQRYLSASSAVPMLRDVDPAEMKRAMQRRMHDGESHVLKYITMDVPYDDALDEITYGRAIDPNKRTRMQPPANRNLPSALELEPGRYVIQYAKGNPKRLFKEVKEVNGKNKWVDDVRKSKREGLYYYKDTAVDEGNIPAFISRN